MIVKLTQNLLVWFLVESLLGVQVYDVHLITFTYILIKLLKGLYEIDEEALPFEEAMLISFLFIPQCP